ncbi:MAG: alanine--tRNA ligase [Nanoarchaeota archaeon]|nr:alanine--tRNA ligase [Nanoarchaeota archaeon]
MLLSDKEQKKLFKIKAQKNPDQNYPILTLKELGFQRKQCKKCKTYFWTVNPEQETCGDSICSGGYKFIGNSPAKKKMDYIASWKEFSRIFKRMGYTPIKRYPVVARWNPTMEYTIASIASFQPYVVTGEAKPPANPLVIPQFCLRFNDVDNVGITGSHYTGFIMIGQHAFMTPEEYDINKYLREIHTWLKDGLGLPNKEITFHEDAWAGGGNFGPSMEFFSRGLELGNQVYMQYEQLPKGNYKELNIKVLDMGMGHERNAWFTSGEATSYESTFPTVVKKLHKMTGVEYDKNLMNKFAPYAALLNVDEIDNVNQMWKTISKKIDVGVAVLQKNIIELAALYSIADHTRSLLFSLADGALPSNVGGSYNLRMILRRALSFIDKYGWNIDINDVCKEHARYLKPLFPELLKNLDGVQNILEVEKAKYENTKQKSQNIVARIIKKDISSEKLVELYDSKGITPEIIRDEASKYGKNIKIPDNFYAKVAERHEKKEQVAATRKDLGINLKDVPETNAKYFDDYLKTKFKAKALKIDGKYLILDETYFYPTSGGQMHDTGSIQKTKVVDVVKIGNIIVHVMEKEIDQAVAGHKVNCEIDIERREQLAQHHTSTHIVNAAAKRVLGKHINQAGAKKTKEKAHIDLTHYKAINNEELEKIEDEANKIVREAIPIRCSFMPRDEAEKRYGMGIYQGGAVPGQRLRIVEIPEVDVECCAGTHLKNTKEAGEIKLLKSTKVSDAVVRITFVAGKASKKEEKKEHEILEETAKILKVRLNEVFSRAEELFTKWKKARKAFKKGKYLEINQLKLSSRVAEKISDEELLKKTAEIFSTQPEHVPKTAARFLEELKKYRDEISKKL